MESLSLQHEVLADPADVCVVRAEGFVDTNTASDLERELRSCAGEGHPCVILDLEMVDYVSSAGWTILVSTIRYLRQRGGDLRLVGMRRDVEDIFQLLQFSSILETFPDLESAIAAGNPQG